MAKQNHVAANLQQDFTDAEKEQARVNIGASQVESVSGARPPVHTPIPTLTFNEMNRKLVFGERGNGLLVPEPTSTENNYHLVATWSAISSGVYTGCHWEAMPTPEPGVPVAIYAGSPQMSETEFAKIQQAVRDNKIVYVLFGTSGGSYYFGLVKHDPTGYGFMYESNTLKEYLHVDNNRNVTRTTLPSGGPSAYWLGNGIWQDNLTLSGQTSSTHLRDVIQDVTNPVTLYAGKKYLVTPSCHGTAEYTTARSYNGTARWSMQVMLTEEGYDTTYGKCLIIGNAQFYFNGQKGSDTAGYHFNVGISPVTSVIQPESTLVLKKIALVNSGNILGTDSNNTSKIFMDYDLGHVVVQEIA